MSPTDENLEQRQNMKMNLDGTKIGLQQKTHQFEVYEKNATERCISWNFECAEQTKFQMLKRTILLKSY